MANKLCMVFVCLAPYWLNIFDIVLTLFGVKYTGIENSIALVLYGIIILSSLFSLYVFGLLRDVRIRGQELIFFVAIMVYLILYLLSGDYYWGNALRLLPYIRKSIVYCTIGMLSFYIIKREHWHEKYSVISKWFAILSSVVIAFRMLPQISREWEYIDYYGTLRYQSMGYLCAYIIAILFVCMLTDKSPTWRFLYSILIGINLLSLLLSGGRGAVLALFGSIVVVFFVLVKKRHIYWILIGVSVSVLAAIPLANTLDFSQMIPDSFAARTFNYITGNSISLDSRTDLFHQSFNIIKASPIIGYGVGASYYYIGNYPHNLFLELLIEGGFFYAIIITVILIYRFFVWIKYIKSCKAYRITFALILINLVNLLLSGTYYINAWFFLFLFFDPVHKPIESHGDEVRE